MRTKTEKKPKPASFKLKIRDEDGMTAEYTSSDAPPNLVYAMWMLTSWWPREISTPQFAEHRIEYADAVRAFAEATSKYRTACTEEARKKAEEENK